jgi:hypothetical protein
VGTVLQIAKNLPPLLFYEQRAFNFRFWIFDFGLQQLQTKNKETVLPLSTQNSQRRLFADYTDFHGFTISSNITSHSA